MSHICLWMCLLLIFSNGEGIVARERILPVVPSPRQVQWNDGGLVIDDHTVIVQQNNISPSELLGAADLQEALRTRLNLNLQIRSAISGIPETSTIVIGNPDEDPLVAERMAAYGLFISERMIKEGYVLGVGNRGVVIGGKSPAGILYGCKTLEQMLVSDPSTKTLPAVTIHDWPDRWMRGIHDEISYGQVSTMENFRDIFRFMAQFKLNTYMIYLEDTFRFKAFPFIGIGRGALTREQVDAMEVIAQPYNIDIVPIFETLGNQGALLMLPEMLPYAEYPGAHSFAPDTNTVKFMETCFDELTAAFDSKYFHPGLDESWDVGYGRTESLVEKRGCARVHADYYLELVRMLKARGKQLIIYADMVNKNPELRDMIPNDIIIQDHSYAARERFPNIVKNAEKGFPSMGLPGCMNWGCIFPMISKSLVNIKYTTLEVCRVDGPGSVTCTWGDRGSKNLRELLYYPYAYTSEVTWSPETTDVESFSSRFFTLWNGPGTASQFEAIYALLEWWPEAWEENPLYDYWRHPFMSREGGVIPEDRDLHKICENNRLAQNLLDDLEPRVRYRKGDLDYLRYCARSLRHFGESQRLVKRLNTFEQSYPAPGPEEKQAARAQFLEAIGRVREETVALKQVFRDLWLRTNLPANLHYIMDEYDRLTGVWDEAAERVQTGNFAYNPLTPSQWIYHPDGFTDNHQVQHAWFRKTFTIPTGLRRAELQLYGDTHVKLYVNGQLLGEQLVRINLSAPVNPKLVQLYNIAPLLTDGENCIAIEAHNYGGQNRNLEPGGPERCGGFNLYGEFEETAGHILPLYSDDTWKVTDRQALGWEMPRFDDRGWKTAKGDPKPRLRLTVPDFKRHFPGFVARM